MNDSSDYYTSCLDLPAWLVRLWLLREPRAECVALTLAILLVLDEYDPDLAVFGSGGPVSITFRKGMQWWSPDVERRFSFQRHERRSSSSAFRWLWLRNVDSQ